MATTITSTANTAFEPPALPLLYCELRWYAAYTAANHEKRVAEQLGLRGIENFLPVYASVRRWKDRRVTLQLALFPGYVFVRLALRDRLQVLQIAGVAHLVEFNGVPAALPEEEVAALQKGLASGMRAEPHPYVTIGRRVRVTQGPLAGLEGIVQRMRGGTRVVLSLDLIQRSVAVDVDALGLEPAHGCAMDMSATQKTASTLGARWHAR